MTAMEETTEHDRREQADDQGHLAGQELVLGQRRNGEAHADGDEDVFNR